MSASIWRQAAIESLLPQSLQFVQFAPGYQAL
jgi:hypothetical protein